MSTNHTTNYDLNQWEGTDKVLRTEFNADNAKIDAALKANADAIAAEAAAREALAGTVSEKADASSLPYARLAELVISSSAQSASLDVSDVDFTQYRQIEVDALVPAGDGTLQFRVNGITSGYRFTSTDVSATNTANYLGTAGGAYICRMSPPKAGTPVGCWNTFWNGHGDTHRYCVANIDWEELTTLNLFRPSNPLPAGTRFTVYGLRG